MSSRFIVLALISAFSLVSADHYIKADSLSLTQGLIKRHYTPELCRAYGYTWNYSKGTCVDIYNDPNNCGGVNYGCPDPTNGSPACVNARCNFTCDSGFSFTGSSCVNTSSDVNNCGRVNTRCITSVTNASPLCKDSICRATCNTGFTAVDGMCKDQKTDSLNCGRVGNICQVVTNALSNICTNSICLMTCKLGYVLSSGQCILKASQAPRKRKLAKELSLCPTGETACPFAGTASFASTSHNNITRQRTADLVKGSDGYECLDTTTSLESCGGCGIDCTQISNTLGVGCLQGHCIIFSCMPGYEQSKDGFSCQASLSRRSTSSKHPAGRRNKAAHSGAMRGQQFPAPRRISS